MKYVVYSHRLLFAGFLAAMCILVSSCNKGAVSFNFNQTNDRIWIGSDFWAVPLEDWKVENGRIECLGRLSNSRVNILTHQLSGNGTLDLNLTMGIHGNHDAMGSAGLRLAMTDHTDNSYKSVCYHGKGVDVGINTSGKLFINDDEVDLPADFDFSDMQLRIHGFAIDTSAELTVTVQDMNGVLAALTSNRIGRLKGMIALVNQYSSGRMQKADMPAFWFDDLTLGGSMVEETPENAFGPILFSMYTLSKETMKMSVQMPPLGNDDNKMVTLQLLENNSWTNVSEAEIIEPSWVATFKIEEWDDSKDQPYRLVYRETMKNGATREAFREGMIRKDPVDKPLSVGGFTCQFDYGFPYTPLVENVDRLDPDLLYFSGDQIYEANGGYGIIRFPADRAILNYLGKWYMFGWAFGDLMKDRPTITIPDDHEVFQGNLWGAGGKTVSIEVWNSFADCSEGFVQPLEMVDVVMKTNCSQLPDPVDPTPMNNGIAVYYTDLLYGNVSFAIVGDRVFKSGAENISWWEGRRDHIRFPVDARKLDQSDLQLLGNRQLEFLKNWAEDWQGAEFKCLLSQTIFANASTHHGGNKMFLHGDMDSGGWPKSGRDRAVRAIRKAAAFHICGDQHLPSIAQYGIDDYRQAGWVFCTPAITTGYERRFMPELMNIPIQNKPDHSLPNTGEFTDVFGNPHFVYAVGNPEDKTTYPNRYRQAASRSSGFGMTIFNPENGDIRNEAYKFNADLSKPLEDNMFPGWPVTINKLDNLGSDAAIDLPVIRTGVGKRPVVKVYDNNDELVFAVRTNGGDFTPRVRKEGSYRIVVGYPEQDLWREYNIPDKNLEIIEI